MTQAKLMKLYVKLSKGEITASQIAELKDFSDEEIDLILMMNNQSEIKTLLKDKEFRNLPEKTQRRLISIFETYASQSFSTHYATKVATDKNAIASGYVIELTKLIIGCEKEKEHVEIAYNAALNPLIIKNGKVVATVISILSASDKEAALKIYEDAMKQAYSKEFLVPLKNGTNNESSFWDLFIADPDKAIAILSTAIFPNSADPLFQQYELIELSDKPVLAEPTIVPLYSNIREAIAAKAKETEISRYARVRRKTNSRKES